ncbi:MAG: AAA family ATPase [Clostridium sp.]|nr:AAA family ATPase [Clostridium sp.]
MLKKIKFKGGFFSEETELELFMHEDRISLLYGKNGSGKSTISKAVRKAKGDVVDDIVQATLLDQEDTVFSGTQCIHVFNEDYVSSRVKIRDDGLNTIILLGELGDLEDKILDLELRIEAESNRNIELKTASDEYKDRDNKKSPSNCRIQINLGLSGEGHWAEREKIINNGKRNAGVTDKVIDSIIAQHPAETLADLRKRYEENLQLLRQVRENEAAQIRNTVKLNVQYDEKVLQGLLAQKVESTVLSDREQYLLRLIDDGKLDQINEMKFVFSTEKTKKCPFCFQEISDQGKRDLISSIEKVLSKEVDIHEKNLKKCIIPELSVDFSGMDVLNSPNYIKCKDVVEEINKEISKIREIILKKINHPYTPITDFENDLIYKLEQYELARTKLQQEIETYNNAVKRIGALKRNLIADNAAIAHYEVSRDIELWKQALEDQKNADEALKKSNEKIINLNDELNVLKSRKKNIKIAVNLINKSLRYVFFSKDRLKIKVEDDKYVLYAYGKAVKPNNVSVGERNIIALCYYFTELIMNQEAKEGYSKKLILVIDDPVSSFDFENKVGIMSLLKAKIADIIKTNPESQILLMTHDIQCLYDLQKIGEEVCSEYKRESNGQKKVTYTCRELKNKEIIPFSFAKRNEYSEILKTVYDYACSEDENNNMIIGNLMRRVLEAFSTFVYKTGIADISCDDTILQQIGDKDYIDYFKNLMYRLVLNGDSHMQERTNSLDDMDYLYFLSDEERRRTAQEVICFIYLLNKRHVLAHLEGKQNIETNIQKWCADIKSFYAGDEVTI